jgi:hypothetical protein
MEGCNFLREGGVERPSRQLVCRVRLRYVGLLHFVSCGVCQGGPLPENQVLGVAFEWDRKGS